MPGFMSRGASIFEAVVSAWPSYQTQHNHSESLIWEIYSLRTPLPYLISKPPQWKRRKCCLFVFLWHLCRKVKGVLLLGWQMSELKGCWIWLQRGYKDTHTHTHACPQLPRQPRRNSRLSYWLTWLARARLAPCATSFVTTEMETKEVVKTGFPQHIRWAERTPAGLKRGAERGRTGKWSRFGPQFNHPAVILTDSSEQHSPRPLAPSLTHT